MPCRATQADSVRAVLGPRTQHISMGLKQPLFLAVLRHRPPCVLEEGMALELQMVYLQAGALSMPEDRCSTLVACAKHAT